MARQIRGPGDPGRDSQLNSHRSRSTSTGAKDSKVSSSKLGSNPTNDGARRCRLRRINHHKETQLRIVKRPTRSSAGSRRSPRARHHHRGSGLKPQPASQTSSSYPAADRIPDSWMSMPLDPYEQLAKELEGRANW